METESYLNFSILDSFRKHPGGQTSHLSKEFLAQMRGPGRSIPSCFTFCISAMQEMPKRMRPATQRMRPAPRRPAAGKLSMVRKVLPEGENFPLQPAGQPPRTVMAAKKSQQSVHFSSVMARSAGRNRHAHWQPQMRWAGSVHRLARGWHAGWPADWMACVGIRPPGWAAALA